VALSATIYNFTVQLSDVDRGVYEALAVKVAQHPSEANDHLMARMLAYCLEYTEGLTFSRGIGDPDEPALAVRDLTGVMKAWIDIGLPDAARLHRASKAAPRVAVYTHRPPALLLRQLEGERIHRAEALELYAFDRELIDGLVKRLERRMSFDLAVTDRHLFISLERGTVSGDCTRIKL
jgi:uncharacterized protein YaeQ